MGIERLGSIGEGDNGKTTNDGAGLNCVGVSLQRNQCDGSSNTKRMGSGADRNLLALFGAASYLAIASVCSTIDPGVCRPRPIEVSESATDHPLSRIQTQSFTDAAVFTDSCTWCGKNPGVK